MPKVCYTPKKFSGKSLIIIEKANEIIQEYKAQGYTLNLRQLYYKFVARDFIPNKQSEYKRLGSIINDARLAGMIDWRSIEDRTRNLESLAHWSSPQKILEAVSGQYLVNRWKTQPYRIEVWIEKEALAGVFAEICEEWDIAYFSCRGYVSQSEMWSAAQRLIRYERPGRFNPGMPQETRILHFGDHDPSGMDMTRDIRDRLHLFGSTVEVERIALNMDQIEQYGPPPNPAKLTDSRADSYTKEYGFDSWELDALEPSVLNALVHDKVEEYLDPSDWNDRVEEEEEAKQWLSSVADNWDRVVEFMQDSDE